MNQDMIRLLGGDREYLVEMLDKNDKALDSALLKLSSKPILADPHMKSVKAKVPTRSVVTFPSNENYFSVQVSKGGRSIFKSPLGLARAQQEMALLAKSQFLKHAGIKKLVSENENKPGKEREFFTALEKITRRCDSFDVQFREDCAATNKRSQKSINRLFPR